MGKAKGRHKQERRLVDMTQVHEDEVDASSSIEPTEEDTDVIEVTRDGRVWQRAVRNSLGEIVDFAAGQQVRIGGRWQDVVRYDCSHGYVHEHRFKRTKQGAEETRVMPHTRDLSDLEKTMAAIVEELLDDKRFMERRRRYMRYGKRRA